MFYISFLSVLPLTDIPAEIHKSLVSELSSHLPASFQNFSRQLGCTQQTTLAQSMRIIKICK